MAKFALKSRPTSRYPVRLDGETFEVEISKLSITDLLVIKREGAEIKAQIEEAQGEMPPEAHTTLVEAVCGLVVAIYGLMDEDDQEILWSSLSTDQRLEILGDVHVDDLFAIFNGAWEIGRLKAEEKKV